MQIYNMSVGSLTVAAARGNWMDFRGWNHTFASAPQLLLIQAAAPSLDFP